MEAVQLVTRCLSSGDFEPLADLVCPECLKAVKEGISLYSAEQKRALNFTKEDIHLYFIYQVGYSERLPIIVLLLFFIVFATPVANWPQFEFIAN